MSCCNKSFGNNLNPCNNPYFNCTCEYVGPTLPINPIVTAGSPNVIGPTGPTGPTGPIGPQGASGILSTAFFTAPNATDAEPTLILENSYPLNQTDISLAGGNGINLTAGTYLMRYGSTVTSTNGTPPTIAIAVNGLVENGTIRTGVAFGSANLTGDALITIAAPSILSLNVTESPDLSYDENFIIISKLGE